MVIPYLIATAGLLFQGNVETASNLAEFRAAVQSAKPGDRILLKSGTYDGGIFLTGVHGQAGRPIIIGGVNKDAPPIIRNGGTGIQISKLSHVVLQDIVIDGPKNNGINLDDGGDIKDPSHHVTLRRITVRNLPAGNHDGIKLSGIDDFRVEDCMVYRWGGSGIDMVGCHRGVIEDCRFLEGGDSGVQAKGGSSQITVRSCNFEMFGQRGVNMGGSTGPQFFRPPFAGMNPKYEARDMTVEGCTFIKGGTPVALVGVDGAKVAFNTLFFPSRWAIRILQETNLPGFVPSRNGVFADNLIVFSTKDWSSGGINIGPNTDANSFRFARNHWFCSDNAARSPPSLPTKEVDGVYGTDPGAGLASNGSVFVRESGAAQKVGAHAFRRKR